MESKEASQNIEDLVKHYSQLKQKHLKELLQDKERTENFMI